MSDEEKESYAKRIETAVVKWIEHAVENPSLATAIFGIPTFGAPIYQALNIIHSHAVQRRMQQLILSLHGEAENIDSARIDLAFFETEEFYDSVRKVVEYTSRTRDNAKIRLYARILTRLPLLDNIQFRNSAEDFLSILLELSAVDLNVGKVIYRQQKDLPLRIRHTENEVSTIKSKGWLSVAEQSGVGEADYDLALRKLYKVGLIEPIRQPDEGYRISMYMITPTFRTLMALVDTFD